MKTLKINAVILLTALLAIGCSGDDDTPPAPVNEEEVITTVLVNLVAEGDVITLESRDLDGDGPNEPVISVSGNLISGLTYVGS
ncbi:MAG: type 1 periplasmic binding fold superfamily protein, partial [Marinirhabdus sp.]|nr:type 1 periplasmic binding fold superfamily protein [Marinirhabdus sp.]